MTCQHCQSQNTTVVNGRPYCLDCLRFDIHIEQGYSFRVLYTEIKESFTPNCE